MTAFQLPSVDHGAWAPPGSERQKAVKQGLPLWHHFGYSNLMTCWCAREMAGLGACWHSSSERVFGE